MKRFAFALALSAFALATATASPVVAYSSLGDPSGESFAVSTSNTAAFRFVPTLTGSLSGFRLSMFNLGSVGRTPFALTLCADDGGQIGVTLASFEGVSTGIPYWDQGGQLATVQGRGEAITAGSAYWLVATSSGSLAWTATNSDPSPTFLNGDYYSAPAGAFEVSAEPVPEPAALVALTVGLVALRRRGRGA